MNALASLAPSAHRSAFPGLAAAKSRKQTDAQEALAARLGERLLDGLQPLQGKALGQSTAAWPRARIRALLIFEARPDAS